MSFKIINFVKVMQVAFLAVLLFVICSPAMAALPTITTPTTGIGGTAIVAGDFLGIMGAYFKLGITLLGLVIAGLAFITVVTGGMARWKKYSQGQIELGDLKEYLVMAVVVMVFVVFMVKYAFETLA